MRVFKDDHQGTYKLVCQYLFELAWYLQDHRLKLTFTLQISKLCHCVVFEWKTRKYYPHQKCECKAVSVFKHYHSKMLMECQKMLMQCHAGFQGRPLGFIQTSMLVFTLVSTVSLGSHTQAHIYIKDHQTVSYSNGKPGNIFHTRNVSVRP